MSAKKTSVIEDVDAFLAWLSTTPLILAVGHSRPELLPSPGKKSGAAAAADKDFLEALKSMA
jgi:hypothetical protein